MILQTVIALAALLLPTATGLLHAAPRNTSRVPVESSASRGARVRAGIEQLEQWRDSGRAVESGFGAPALQYSVAGITAESYAKELRDLHPRVPGAASYLRASLEHLAFHVADQPILDKGLKRGNVLAFLPGSDLKDEVVVFGARAPDAHDNGSGSAALLQIARAVAGQAKALRRSVILVAFQVEEEGLVGSKAFVSELEKGLYGRLVAAVIADEVSFDGRAGHSRRAILETKGRRPANVALIDTLAHQAQADGALQGFEVSYAGLGSDHIPFLGAGYPAVLLLERDHVYHADTQGHARTEDLRSTDANFGAAMTRLAARAVLSYAVPRLL